jgi:hypothetical protein
MKRLTMVFLAAALAVSVVGPAAAGPLRTPRVDRREWRQHVRIQRGVMRGQLTRREAGQLRTGERHIRRMEWRTKADGRVTARERLRLNRVLDRQSRRIWWMRHNRCWM